MLRRRMKGAPQAPPSCFSLMWLVSRRHIQAAAHHGTLLADRLTALRSDAEWERMPTGIRLEIEAMLASFRYHSERRP